MNRTNLIELKFESMLEEYPDTKIVFGSGAPDQLAELLLLREFHSVFLFAGGSSRPNNKAVDSLYHTFSYMDLDLPVYLNIPAEPTVEEVRKMVAALDKEKPRAVIAIGGGSVMDAAKAAYLSWQTGMDITELFGVNQASRKFPGRHFERVICIPTTSGTGSEATPYSNIVDQESGVKKLVMEQEIIPEYSFVDPEYATTMPRDLTLSTGLDALVHAVESVLNHNAPDADLRSVAWGRQAVKLIAAALPSALENPDDLFSRTYVSAAATLAGMCIRNRPTSLPHLCSFSLYGKVPHGLAVAALLIPFWRYYLSDAAAREATMELRGTFSLKLENTPEEVVDSCETFLRSCGAPVTLSALPGLDRSVIGKIAEDAVLNPMKLKSCPRPMVPEEAASVIRSILEKAW